MFFGLFATLGTLWTQAKEITLAGVLGAVGVGAVAAAILVANNLRDIPTDTEHGKQTLAVRLGDRRTRWFYGALIVVSVACVIGISFVHPLALIALLALGILWKPYQAIRSGRPAATSSGARATGIHELPMCAAVDRMCSAVAVRLTCAQAARSSLPGPSRGSSTAPPGGQGVRGRWPAAA